MGRPRFKESKSRQKSTDLKLSSEPAGKDEKVSS